MIAPVSPSLWQYRYRLDRADIAAFEALRVDGVRPALIMVIVSGGLAGWHFEWIEAHLPFAAAGPFGQAVLGIVIAGLGYVAAKMVGRLRQRWLVTKYSMAPGDTVVDVFDDHIAWRTDGLADLRPWEGVGKVIATAEHVFIFINQDRALIVPLRAFAGATEMAAFAEWADRQIGE